jgi:uncharacterized protein YjbI with pentapeptide repeats
MLNRRHLAKLKEGAKAWNQWRMLNPGIKPNLRGADLDGADLSGMGLCGAELSSANLKAAKLLHTDLGLANITGANLSCADLRWANLNGAYITGAKLRGANLRGADLIGAFLSGVDMRGACLSRAYLRQAELSGANLERANLRRADLTGANLDSACLTGANLNGADLSQATLVGTSLDGAVLSGCRVYGISVWNVTLSGATQSNLLITRGCEPAIQVDNLEVAQFIYLLLNNAKIRDVIDTIGKKAVLILGRFTPERKAILESIREALRELGFLPILFDFEKPGTRDTHETILTLAGMARFIIADISEPRSIPQELASIVPTLPSVPVQPLLETGHEPWGMYDHIKRFPWVLPLVEYKNRSTLLRELKSRVIVPAETKAKEQAPK